MNDLTPEQRSRALELANAFAAACESYEPRDAGSARGYLAVEAHVLASHACPDVESDPRIRAWLAIAEHRFFADCYSTGGTLTDAMIAKLDAAHTHTCKPVWRPTTRDEIEAGWEVRSRGRGGYEMVWGTARDRDADGDWLTEAGNLLTSDSTGWTYETTAPAPEPKSDPRVAVVVEWSNEPASSTREGAAVDLLARLDALTEGDQS